MRRRGLTRSAAIVTVALVIVAFLIYVSFQPAIGWPDESHRISHPSGFSIVEPMGWDHTIAISGKDGALSDAIQFLPIKPLGVPGVFYVAKLKTAPTEADLSKTHATTFQNRPAWQTDTKRERTHEHTRTIVFKDGDTWYEMAVRRPEVENITTGAWQAYFDSLKIPPSSSTLTFSEPAMPH